MTPKYSYFAVSVLLVAASLAACSGSQGASPGDDPGATDSANGGAASGGSDGGVGGTGVGGALATGGSSTSKDGCGDSITFGSEPIEAAVRSVINKPSGPITQADADRVKELDPSSFDEVSTLEGVQCLTYLETLDIREGELITDYGPLSGLEYLKKVSIHDAQATDITALGTLPALETLELIDTSVSDLTPLSELPSLIRLDLAYSKNLGDVSPLCSIGSLYSLRLNDVGLTSAEGFVDCDQLKELRLRANLVSDASPLAEMEQLSFLDIGFNTLSDASPLFSMTTLVSLSIDSQQLGDLDGIENLTQLSFLAAKDIGLTSLEPLTQLPELKQLHVDENLVDCDDPDEQAYVAALEAQLTSTFEHDCQ